MALRHGGSRNAWHGHFEPKRVPEGVWMRCDGCQATLFRKQVEQNHSVCPECARKLYPQYLDEPRESDVLQPRKT